MNRSRPSEASCEGCGRAGAMRSVEVKPIAEAVPDLGVIRLCSDCLQKPGAAWRLRWARVDQREVQRV
jgi:hypothetical protein